MYNLLYGNRLAVDPVRSVYNQADEPTSSSFNSTAKEAVQSLPLLLSWSSTEALVTIGINHCGSQIVWDMSDLDAY